MYGMFSVEKKAFDDSNDASGAVVASADHGNLKDFTFRHRVLFLEKEIKSCLFIGKHAEFIKLNGNEDNYFASFGRRVRICFIFVRIVILHRIILGMIAPHFLNFMG